MTNSPPKMMTPNPNNNETLCSRAQALRLNGLVEHWPEVLDADWVAPLLQWEEDERAHRSLQRRIRDAKLGGFKALSDFDWKWPRRIERPAVEDLMSLAFLNDATNVVFIGPNGVGKSTLAQNVAHQALIQGHTVLFRSASEMLGELAALDSDSALRRRLRYYAAPDTC
jgi:DNA replication protein DnaC